MPETIYALAITLLVALLVIDPADEVNRVPWRSQRRRLRRPSGILTGGSPVARAPQENADA